MAACVRRAAVFRRLLHTSCVVRAGVGSTLRDTVPDAFVKPFNTPGAYRDYVSNNFLTPDTEAERDSKHTGERRRGEKRKGREKKDRLPKSVF